MPPEILGFYRICTVEICGRLVLAHGDGDKEEPDGFPHTHPEVFPFDWNLIHLQVYHHH